MTKKQKLEKFFTKQLASDLKEVLIVQDDTGCYELFGKYIIEPQPNGLFRIIHLNYTEEHVFSSLKNAFTWCIFNKNRKLRESKRIKELDFLLDSVNTSLYQQSRLYLKAKTTESKSIYLAKMHENKVKKNIMLKEISGFINISRHWQQKQFKNKEPK